MRFSNTILVVLLCISLSIESILAFSPLVHTFIKGPAYHQKQQQQQRRQIHTSGHNLCLAADDTSTSSKTTRSTNAAAWNDISWTKDEFHLMQALWDQSNGGTDHVMLQELILQALSSMSPKFIMKLKQTAAAAMETATIVNDNNNNHNDNNNDDDENSSDTMTIGMARALQSVLDERLGAAKQVLASLLSAGELRKLDSKIGAACRNGTLDMAFFTVLEMNLKDAAAAAVTGEEEEEMTDNNNDNNNNNNNNDQKKDASRFSILQHIYTRCQEEVEKLVPPGVALLNKLLRTSSDSIRVNQLQHYLCPQPNGITLPDGQVIPVPDRDQNRVLVPHSDLIAALGTTVQQIRTMETAGGVTRTAAANMVEACRTVAKEARIVIGTQYGKDGDELRTFEEGLQPVFRPDSPESPYIQGE